MSGARRSRSIVCLRCEKFRPHKARQLCSTCYSWLRLRDRDALSGYPTAITERSMDVDEVAVDRAIEWLSQAITVPWSRREYRTYPEPLTLGEQIEVMRRTENMVGREAVQRLLGAYSKEVAEARDTERSGAVQ